MSSAETVARRGRSCEGFSRPSAGGSSTDQTYGHLAIERVELLGDPDELDLGERVECRALEIVAREGERRAVEETLQRVLVLRGERGPETREANGGRIALPGVREIDTVRELASLVVAAQRVPSR